ncbi:MAG: hypothetical protein NWE80_02985 [Candidatus Bathyarchaeota archaeon]|nr:hypothetical protein [Candidatus Bathyarchaeota archaeon]
MRETEKGILDPNKIADIAKEKSKIIQTVNSLDASSLSRRKND